MSKGEEALKLAEGARHAFIPRTMRCEGGAERQRAWSFRPWFGARACGHFSAPSLNGGGVYPAAGAAERIAAMRCSIWRVRCGVMPSSRSMTINWPR